MKTAITLATIILVCTAHAAAQQRTTLQEVTAKGIAMDAGGMQIDVTYKPDGSFTAAGGEVTGKWRIDGEKLCTTSNFQPKEECTLYPAGKKSGDSFELTGELTGERTGERTGLRGATKITIK